MQISENASLKPYNTLGFSVKARYLIQADSDDHLREALDFAQSKGLPTLLLGGGSNIVLSKDFDGVAIHLCQRGKVADEQGDCVLLNVRAGENWDQLVRWTLDNQLYGLENLSLIPGNIGAAPIQNIGAYGVELTDVFDSLEAIKISTGEPQHFSRSDCRFDYRDSVFKNELRDQYAIVSVTLSLSRSPTLNIEYGALKTALQQQDAEITPQRVSQVVRQIRQSKLPDPAVLGNAGSFFKNPVVDAALAAQLRENHPEIPVYPQSEHKAKLAAGWLIEQCGFKGCNRDGVGVHEEQALVLVNRKGGTGDKLLNLAQEIQDTVSNRFGVSLEIEPRVY